jgi:hypothetical protein
MAQVRDRMEEYKAGSGLNLSRISRLVQTDEKFKQMKKR